MLSKNVLHLLLFDYFFQTTKNYVSISSNFPLLYKWDQDEQQMFEPQNELFGVF